MADDALLRLEAAALKAREVTHTVGERCYTLRTPTRREVRECVLARGLGRSVGDAMFLPLLRLYLLQQFLVGWTGVRQCDLLPGGAADPWPWSPGAVALLLDQRPAEADELARVLMAEADKRNEAIEADAKNSQPTSSARAVPTWAVSPGSASAPMPS